MNGRKDLIPGINLRFEHVQTGEHGHASDPSRKKVRLPLRIAAQDKSLVMRAAVLQHTNLAEFIIPTAVSAEREVIDKNERIELTQRDSLHIMDLLEEPPAPNEKLMAAVFALPK